MNWFPRKTLHVSIEEFSQIKSLEYSCYEPLGWNEFKWINGLKIILQDKCPEFYLYLQQKAPTSQMLVCTSPLGAGDECRYRTAFLTKLVLAGQNCTYKIWLKIRFICKNLSCDTI